MPPKPGEIYLALRGDPPKRRPVIIVSRVELNRGDYVVAVPVTSQRFSQREPLPNCVPFRAGEHGFPIDCVAQAEGIAILHADAIVAGPIGSLDETAQRDLIRAIGYVIASECEPAP